MLDATIDSGAYILGILWALCSRMGEEGYWIRHRDPWYIDAVRTHLRLATSPHFVRSRTGVQARLKVVRRSEVALFDAILLDHGWTERNSLQRPYPSGLVDDRAFVRAWVEIHGVGDIARIGRKRRETPRLRVYGNWDMLEDINRVVSHAIGQPPRLLQKTTNQITKAVYYYGNSYKAVAAWLYASWELSNPTARERILSLL